MAMELLFDPSIAYLLLVFGFILTLLAIASPGTGLLEAGAFFTMALVGYIAFKIGLNPWALGVLVIGLVPFVYAMRRPKAGGWLALSILLTLGGSLYLFNSSGWIPRVNPIVALAASVLAGVFIWMVVGKILQAAQREPSHDLQRLIGQTGDAKTRVHESGTVQVAGELWSARSDKEIPSGKPVRVVGREGFVLIVEKAGD